MSNDFSKYKKIINSFRGGVKKPDFETKFASMTEYLQKSERFLLKMEIKRLASPCTRYIDLRGLVDGECKPFEYNNQTHFLDDVAIKVFNENITAYGSYTMGVYEAVNNTENNFRVIYQREKQGSKATEIKPIAKSKVQEKLQYPAKFYRFGKYINRCEERMNFAMTISIEFENGQTIDATSSDISERGCKFRFKEMQQITIGQKLNLRFLGLETEFSFGEQNNFTYEVCNIHIEESYQSVGVKRIDCPEKDSFSTFLRGYVRENKRRYKINLDNTIAALQSRSFEHFALPKTSELPVFVEEANNQFIPRYVLTSHNNQETLHYWKDEARHSTLYCLINSDRMQRIKNAAKLGRSLLVYSFIHQVQGRSVFYTADEKQLEGDKAFREKFLGFAASKESFAITELSCAEIDHSFAHSPYTLANSLPKKDEYLNLPPSDEVVAIVSRYSTLVLVKNITHKILVADYQQLSYEKIDAKILKSFGHGRLLSPLNVKEVGINYRNHRLESRFKYNTEIVLQQSGVQWLGKSIDFSVSGLQIELSKAAVLSKGEIVYLSLPHLQKITQSFELKNLPYEVVKISTNKTTINLRVFVEKHQHVGRSFFKILIDKNKNKLTPDEYELMTPGLGKALRNIYSHYIKSNFLFIQTSGSRYKVEAISSSEEQAGLFGQMRELSDRPLHYNLYPILNNQHAAQLMTSVLKKLQYSDIATTDILYISVNHSAESIDNIVTTRLASQIKSSKLTRMFIEKAQKRGSFFCLMVKLSRADTPDMEFLHPELSYLSSYAIHRGKQLEQEIWSVNGVIQCFDITKEALLRYQVTKNAELINL